MAAYRGVVMPGDLDIAWRTVRQEAAGEPYAGKVAVGWVLRNRVERAPRDRWCTLAQVCLDWLQFSGWREQDPTFAGSLTADLDATGRACLRAVLEALDGDVDPTKGACHYYAPAVLPTPPSWARGRTPSLVLGGHHFFAGVP